MIESLPNYLVSKVKFVMSDETNLADLLALNLHCFEDEVSTLLLNSLAGLIGII